MLGDKVKEIRKELGFTQEEFSKKLGISRSYLGDIERGRLKGNNVSIISKLSDVTGKPMEYFLGKDTVVNPLETLDTALDLIIAKGKVDKNGGITEKRLEKLVLDIVKQELQLKMERLSKE